MSSLSIGRAWDEAKAALQANRKLIVPVALGMILLPAVIASMVEPQVPPGVQPPAGPWMLVVLVMLIVMLVGQLAIVMLVNGWRGSVGGAIGQSARRSTTLILAALAVMIPVILVFSILFAIVAPVSATGQVDWMQVGTAGWLLMLACLVALLFLAIRLLPLVAVVASEPIGPIQSLKRGFSLTSGHFWRLFGFVVLVVIAFLILALTVQAVVGSLVTLLFGPPEPWSISLLFIALAGGLVQAAFVMVYTAMLARIYVQLSAAPIGVPDVKRED